MDGVHRYDEEPCSPCHQFTHPSKIQYSNLQSVLIPNAGCMKVTLIYTTLYFSKVAYKANVYITNKSDYFMK